MLVYLITSKNVLLLIVWNKSEVRMNIKQLDFVLDHLGFKTPARRFAIQAVIIDGSSAYNAERTWSIPKSTLKRDVNKCEAKWEELLKVAKTVNKLGDEHEEHF